MNMQSRPGDLLLAQVAEVIPFRKRDEPKPRPVPPAPAPLPLRPAAVLNEPLAKMPRPGSRAAAVRQIVDARVAGFSAELAKRDEQIADLEARLAKLIGAEQDAKVIGFPRRVGRTA